LIAGTHLAFASVLYLGGATVFEYRTDWLGWALAAACALGPDIDLPTSKPGRLLFWLSTRLERRFGHRTITHSALAMGAVALLASPLLLVKPLYYGCVMGGYWSHLWIDMVNVRGADLFWPSPLRVVMPGNRHWRIEVGSKAEMILLSVLIAVAIALYPLSNLGFRGGLQLLIASFEIAHDEFLKDAGTRWYRLELVATDNLTLAQVECQCPVLGTWEKGLIVLQDGKPRAVGKSQVSHNLYPLHARLLEGPPLHVVSGEGGHARAHAARAHQPDRQGADLLPVGGTGDCRATATAGDRTGSVPARKLSGQCAEAALCERSGADALAGSGGGAGGGLRAVLAEAGGCGGGLGAGGGKAGESDTGTAPRVFVVSPAYSTNGQGFHAKLDSQSTAKWTVSRSAATPSGR
jgi:membrane-bound metal-dependent hydrolase YbcI (DUF457 family)